MLASLIGSIISGEAIVALRRAKSAAIVYALAAVFACIGACFLLVAAFILAARRFGPIDAALGFGGGFLVLALLTVLISKLATGSRRRRAAERRKGEAATIAVTAALALLPALASKRAGLSLLVAPALAILGYKIFDENRRSPRDRDDGE